VSSRLITLPMTSGFHSMTYMDYVLNPCSVIQLTATINTDAFATLKLMKADTPIIVALYAFGTWILGEVVSYSATASVQSGVQVSLLLMPPGVARPFPADKINTDLFGGTSAWLLQGVGNAYNRTQLRNGTHNYPNGSAQFSGRVELTALNADSTYSMVMKYRKTHLITGIRNFINSINVGESSPSLWHRIIYFTFPMVASNPDRTFSNANGRVLFGDHDMVKGATGGGDLLAAINPGAFSNVTVVASNQGLLNNAYYHIPRETQTLAAHAAHFVNEVMDVNVQDLVKATEAFKAMGPDPNNGRLFRSFSSRIDSAVGVSPWSPGTFAYHIRSIYTYSGLEGGGTNSTGISAKFTLARMNPTFCPIRPIKK
jgi:hypothetical protein